MTFQSFQVECSGRGLTARRRNDTHWQIYYKGVLMMDVWPTADKWRPVYGLSSERRKASGGDPMVAIRYANDLANKVAFGPKGASLPETVAEVIASDPTAELQERLQARQDQVHAAAHRTRPMERIYLDPRPINVKVFRGSHGKGGESAQLRRACDWLNREAGDWEPGKFQLTPDLLAAALKAEPSAAEYRDGLRGLLDCLRYSAQEIMERPKLQAELATAERRAEELLRAGSQWEGGPPAAGDTIIVDDPFQPEPIYDGRGNQVRPAAVPVKNVGGVKAEAGDVLQVAKVWETIDLLFDGPPGPEGPRFIEAETPDGKSINVGEWVQRDKGMWALRLKRPRYPETEAEYRKRTRARITALANALRGLMNRCGGPDTEPHWGGDFVVIWDDCEAALAGLAEPPAAGPVTLAEQDDELAPLPERTRMDELLEQAEAELE